MIGAKAALTNSWMVRVLRVLLLNSREATSSIARNDWIGREAKGGQAWLTYHFSGNEYAQLEFLRKVTPENFIHGPYDIPTNTYSSIGGASQTSFKAQVVKRFGRDLELNGNFSYEHYLVPIYLTNRQTVTTTSVQLTWYPERKTSF